VLTHSYAVITQTPHLGTSSISGNVTLCKSPVSRVATELVLVLSSSPLAKFLQLDGFKQNSFINRSISKRICSRMLLWWKLLASAGHWPSRGGHGGELVAHGWGRATEGILIRSCSHLMGF